MAVWRVARLYLGEASKGELPWPPFSRLFVILYEVITLQGMTGSRGRKHVLLDPQERLNVSFECSNRAGYQVILFLISLE